MFGEAAGAAASALDFGLAFNVSVRVVVGDFARDFLAKGDERWFGIDADDG